ncbi:LOW QUALITY PROTEIN: DNA polymerase kappa [Telopea speciosissima]|uniref:LOW QUALITY PROTEIN: DNA polymerase kappa n=1 Tax=Telopea speciosissima TaxID=54955 RepID=UPI001CC52892|nr:LOW QUALITY PROTEIN: DNA polymerase kappa [Telopea speciosissima]
MGETSESAGAARPWQSYHTVYTNAKAGMDGVDKEKVQRIVYEMSKGSKYFENEERKEAFIRQKVENMRARCAKLTTMDMSHYQMVADKRIFELEAARDLSKIWLHVDMDAFYAAVETLENPSLKGKPMAVGSMSMLSTANYEARKFGVRAAMPGFIACKLCPELIFVPIDFEKYTYYSDLTRKGRYFIFELELCPRFQLLVDLIYMFSFLVFQKYDPNFMATSLDEAYLDITEVCKGRGISSGEVAEELRRGVYEETGLTCSAGVAPNQLLAKVCSDINKPNGQFVLPNDRMAVTTFISSLPIRKIGGIGKVTEHILRDVLEIHTCEEMLQKSAFLCALFSHSSIDFFLSVGLGLGKTDSPQTKLRKSMSSERTFSATNDEQFLYQKLADTAEMLANDMEKGGLRGRTLTLKLKTASFEVRTRAVSLQNYICSSQDILSHASKLLKTELPLSLRLIGLRMSQFNDEKRGLADRMQKTLMNFFTSGVSSEKAMSNNNSIGSGVDDNHLMFDTKTGLPVDSQIHHLDAKHSNDLGDPSNSNQSSDTEHGIFSNDACEMEKIHEPLSNKSLAKVVAPNVISYVTQSQGSEMVESQTVSFFGQSKGNNMEGGKERVSLTDKTILSSNQQEQPFWVDGYKCSLCGVELPPSFAEERQEHFDYHFAERLQKMESGHNSRYPSLKQRSICNSQIAKENRRKKLKSSPKDGKHLPIDLFFAKSSQNF